MMIKKSVEGRIDLKGGESESEVSSREPGRDTVFIFKTLEKTSSILG